MENWLNELVREFKKYNKKFKDIKYAWVSNFDIEYSYSYEKPSYIIIYNNDEENIDRLVKRLESYNYDDWYGVQNLFWEIVFNDDTRLERWEYDGAERWEYKKTPDKIDYKLFRDAEKEREEENE